MMSSYLKRIALIVAGGSGSRMLSAIPKQFLLLNGKPVLMHTINQFSHCDEIYLVLPKQQFETWDDLCRQHRFGIAHKIVAGGETRFHSVKNGLDAITETDALVAIHDGVRPLVNQQIIENSFLDAVQFGNAIVCVKTKDSIRMTTADGHSENIDRNKIFLVQTPQTFQLGLIRKAYLSAENTESFTDDASVLEAMGAKIHITEGSYSNIKITTPEDLKIATVLLTA